MGQFDKNQSQKPATQKNKAIIVVILALSLGGVVAFQMLKGSPRSASAASNSLVPDTLTPLMASAPASVSDELNELAKDPTAPFLRGDRLLDAAAQVPPRDPFRMSDQWRATLTHTEAIPVIDNSHTNVRQTYVASAPQAADTSILKITGIFRDKDQRTAIINGIIVHPGMVIKNARICDILDDRIIVQNASFPDGPRSELLLKEKFGGK